MDLPTFVLPPWQLRPFAAQDVALYAALFTDAEVMAHIEPPLSAERALGCAQRALWHQRQDHPGFLHWVLCDPAGATGGLFSVARLTVEWAGGEANLGVMVQPPWRKHDIAVRGLRAIGDWVLGPLGVRRLRAEMAKGNRAASHTARRSGFRLLEAGNDAGVQRWVRDSVAMGITH